MLINEEILNPDLFINTLKKMRQLLQVTEMEILLQLNHLQKTEVEIHLQVTVETVQEAILQILDQTLKLVLEFLLNQEQDGIMILMEQIHLEEQAVVLLNILTQKVHIHIILKD